MIDPNFLKLKEYLTLNEAGQYIAHHLARSDAGTREILYLINEQLLGCYIDFPVSILLNPPEDGLTGLTHISKGNTYRVFPVGRHEIKEPQLQVFYSEQQAENVYICAFGKGYFINGTFEADLKNGEKLAVPAVFNNVALNVGDVLGDGMRDSEPIKLKVKFEELHNLLSQLPTDDTPAPEDESVEKYFTAHRQEVLEQMLDHQERLSGMQEQYGQEIHSLREENKRLKEQLNNSPTNSTYAIAGALIEMITAQKTPRRNQTAIKLELEEKGLKGLSKASLDNLFAAANKALQASKDESS